MKLTEKESLRAFEIFANHPGDTRASVTAAIEDFLEDMFKPGELVVGEPVATQRDYRKELWIAIRTQDAEPESADAALAEFDARFGEKQ